MLGLVQSGKSWWERGGSITLRRTCGLQRREARQRLKGKGCSGLALPHGDGDARGSQSHVHGWVHCPSAVERGEPQELLQDQHRGVLWGRDRKEEDPGRKNWGLQHSQDRSWKEGKRISWGLGWEREAETVHSLLVSYSCQSPGSAEPQGPILK